MSEALSALDGATFQGAVTVSEAGLQGMITLRGDLQSQAMRDAACAEGCAMPEPLTITGNRAQGLAWMSPDELLLFCPDGEAGTRLARLREALEGEHAMAVDVSDARAVFCLSGGPVREVLAKLAPVDMAPEAFPPGTFRRSRLAQAPAAFWLEADGTAYVICFRSVALYMFNLLSAAARKGAEVGVFDA